MILLKHFSKKTNKTIELRYFGKNIVPLKKGYGFTIKD
jgi:hypothetical protein